MSEALLAGGITAPLCYYKATVRGFNREDDTSRYILFILYNLLMYASPLKLSHRVDITPLLRLQSLWVPP